jgi:hypothetical protein
MGMVWAAIGKIPDGHQDRYNRDEVLDIHSIAKMAARHNDAGVLAACFAAGCPVHHVDHEGNTYGHHAALAGGSRTLRVWLDAGGNPLSVNHYQHTIGHMAACRDHDILTTWIAAGGDGDARSPSGFHVGHMAAVHGNTSHVITWMDHTKAINGTDVHGMTAMHLVLAHHSMIRSDASGKTHAILDILRRWCDRGGDIHLLDGTGRSIGYVAVDHGLNAVVEAWVEMGGVIWAGLQHPSMDAMVDASTSVHPCMVVTKACIGATRGDHPTLCSRQQRDAFMHPDGQSCAYRLLPHVTDPLVMARIMGWMEAV